MISSFNDRSVIEVEEHHAEEEEEDVLRSFDVIHEETFVSRVPLPVDENLDSGSCAPHNSHDEENKFELKKSYMKGPIDGKNATTRFSSALPSIVEDDVKKRSTACVTKLSINSKKAWELAE